MTVRMPVLVSECMTACMHDCMMCPCLGLVDGVLSWLEEHVTRSNVLYTLKRSKEGELELYQGGSGELLVSDEQLQDASRYVSEKNGSTL